MILDLKKVFLTENERVSLDVSLDMSDADIGSACFTEPVTAAVDVANHAGLVEFTADVSFVFRFDCDRCTSTVSRAFTYKFRHILVADVTDESSDDYIAAPDYKLDTDSLLRDDILLELPSKLLCRNDCKGLCPKCGKNLNEGSCGCELREADPRLAALRQLLAEQ